MVEALRSSVALRDGPGAHDGCARHGPCHGTPADLAAAWGAGARPAGAVDAALEAALDGRAVGGWPARRVRLAVPRGPRSRPTRGRVSAVSRTSRPESIADPRSASSTGVDRTYVMGILNVTPDSFSGDGLADARCGRGASRQARQMVADGADILDIGGESTRPGHAPVPVRRGAGPGRCRSFAPSARRCRTCPSAWTRASSRWPWPRWTRAPTSSTTSAA